MHQPAQHLPGDESMQEEEGARAFEACTDPPLLHCSHCEQAVTGMTREEVLADVADDKWGTFKPKLADALIAHLEPVQLR